MKILIISSEKRADFSSTPSLLALALKVMKHNVEVWRNGFFENFKMPIIKLSEFKKEINEFDVVIATNCAGKVLDFSEIKGKKIFLYFENFDAPILPIGEFSELWTHESYVNLLKYCNPFQKKPITTIYAVEPAIAPEYWGMAKIWDKRKIKVGYNGALQNPKDLDPLLHYYMIARYNFCSELRSELHKKGIGIRLPFVNRNDAAKWKNEFRDTKINLHLSQEFGVGQGALEAGLNKCALVEYCPKELAEAFGLQDNVNCLIVENVKETVKAIKFLRDNDDKAKELGERLYTFALHHTYLKFIPLLSEIGF